ncbi:MAG: alpha/beta fold hydrolase, partial [Bacteroidota bacterium]
SGMTRDMTYRLAPALADRYRVIVFDRPGLGYSDPITPNGTSISDQAALLSAAAQFPQVPAVAIAIYAEPENYQLEHPPTPCGTCRQVMAECEQRGGEQMRVLLLAGSGKIYALPDARSLLPMGFSEDRLKRI